MNKEAIIKLISEPNELSKVSIEQLEEMVQKYPYFHQLHVLLHSKKQLIDSNQTPENMPDKDIEKDIIKEDSQALNANINEEIDTDEFEELEEENSQLPFHDTSLKFNTNNNFSDKTANNLPESNTPEDIVEEDIAKLLNKAGLANADTADDLTLINFLNPETQSLLNNNGLYTYAQLKKLEGNDELELLAKLAGKKMATISLWKEDCDILYQNKYHRLLIEKIGLALKNKQSNLQKINGIGPILEAKLNEIGVLNYQQLASLQKPDIEILTELIDYFPGRIERDEWVSQAALKHEENDQTGVTENKDTDQNNEIARLKAKVEAHKNLKKGIGLSKDNGAQEQSRETFRDWLAKMNRTTDTKDEKKNLLANDLTSKHPI